MSPTIETFERLEEFPSFSSCIICFGRPIIPPLLTTSRRHELQQLRNAAVNKEAEVLRRRKGHLPKYESQISSKTYKNISSDLQSNVLESCALRYPSSKDYHKGISVAISKFPTSGIYSSVHTGAIVCSDVVENNRRCIPRYVNNSHFSSRASAVHCVECSHSNINLDCSLCQAEYDQNFHNSSFPPDISPEVPCRTFSLLQPSVNFVDDEQNFTVEESECGSLPSVICSQKYVVPDTDSESNATCMTQSTDLEKYMELSCEFSSPDNSAAVWDSKSASQQYTLSRSDDASSETIVNTENELTPCASTMAEFTDNIEDELSNADEPANISENKVSLASGALRRAHSVDSYMKIIQSCARNMYVKKSLSEPFNTNLKTSSNIENENKASSSSKTSHLIKEDSKESEDSSEVPEKDNSVQSNKVNVSNHDKILPLSTEESTFQKKHIRQNSYTLEHPSSVLILAHADCTCNFDAKCISPHCSALKDQGELISNFAFTREKVTDVPISLNQGKKFPILSSENSSEVTIFTKEELTPSVVDIFPLVKEDSLEKSNSGNACITQEIQVSESISTSEASSDSQVKEKEPLYENSSDKLNISDNSCDNGSSQEYFKRIYQELQESHEIRVKELFEEQNRQWLKLQEEFKEQERHLYEKLKLSVVSPTGTLSNTENLNLQETNDCSNKEISDVKSAYEDDKASSTNTSTISSEQVSLSDSSLLQNHYLEVPSGSSQSFNSPSKSNCHSENSRASLTPSSESKTPNNSPSLLLDNTSENISKSKNSDTSIDCSCDYNEDHLFFNSRESFPSVHQFPTKDSLLLPHTTDIPNSSIETVPSDKNHYVMSSRCFCDRPPRECKCCSSFNGFDEFDVNHSQFEHLPVSTNKTSGAHIIDLNNQAEQHFFQNSSLSCTTQRKKLVSRNDHFTDVNNAKAGDLSSQKSKDTSSTKETKLVSTYNTLELPSVVNNKSCKISQQSVSEKTKLPVDNIVSSLCAKTLRNGSISSLNVSTNRQIIIHPMLLKKFEKLPAFVKGYLTRRLLKTEHVQNLIKTLQDTALLIGKLGDDLSMKGDSVSERDVDFHRQLIVQLMTTFHNIYDIFCTISTKEKMNIIAESRNLRLKQTILEQKQESGSDVPVTSKAPVPGLSKKPKLSSATLKALERKRRSAIDSRTYTIEDFKSFRARSVIENRTYTIEDFKSRTGRSRSCMLSKSHSTSPSAIYKTSVGLSPKRKVANSKTSGSRRCLHMKWLP